VNTTQHNTENYKDEQHGHHQTIWGEHNTTQHRKLKRWATRTPPKIWGEHNTTQHRKLKRWATRTPPKNLRWTQHNTENKKDEQHGHHQNIWGEHNTTQHRKLQRWTTRTPPNNLRWTQHNTTQHNTEN
jgi:hypothetical protein